MNPNGTGCISAEDGILGSPGYMWDGNHTLLGIKFGGASAAPDPAAAYDGDQVIIVKTDGTTFANGDGWKCITCGVPEENKLAINSNIVDYPQAFRDGKRALVGTNILDCGDNDIISDACTPEQTRIYPIAADGTGGIMRELRIHPDGIHLGYSNLFRLDGKFEQLGTMGRLTFDETPAEGAPRYELSDISFMLSPDPQKSGRFISVDPENPDHLLFDDGVAVVGEFRGWTNDGKSILGIGSQDSFNYDVFTTDLQTGESTRRTTDPAYTDPVKTSPDDEWTVLMDGRVDDRMYFASALPVPPLIELANSSALGYLYNNGDRRFFQPYLVDQYGERGEYQGQQINGGGDEAPGNGGISDPLWAGRADPQWSPDGTNIVYYQALVSAPACGPDNPQVRICPTSNEQGGRDSRLMIAELTDRRPDPRPAPEPISDDIPWGTPWEEGDPIPVRGHVPPGTYILEGHHSGEARVVLTENDSKTDVNTVDVTYTDYSNDGDNFINGTESSERTPYTWHADLTITDRDGNVVGTRKTSEPEGFVVIPEPGQLAGIATITGTLTTTVGDRIYRSPTTGN
ncbi:hypothetical protein [Rhodococcus artemisiae]|uniref:WD40 repeat protein n=1 Tax=Rhodococcus artemisiae TaxID=714159 RepID=A0ABU7LAC2_9NOCA|nr:hypothetical protein [Rhodococcus artemisiae]MEE2058237.1 hypothetical protein [Rhodococcus artemisiae]